MSFVMIDMYYSGKLRQQKILSQWVCKALYDPSIIGHYTHHANHWNFVQVLDQVWVNLCSIPSLSRRVLVQVRRCNDIPPSDVEEGEWSLAMSLSKCRLDPSHDDLCPGLSPQSPHPLLRGQWGGWRGRGQRGGGAGQVAFTRFFQSFPNNHRSCYSFQVFYSRERSSMSSNFD
jgi:hypothetical protein